MVDHWLSVDQGTQSAVRRNVIGTDDGTLKGYGIEIIARDVVVTDNVVNRGAHIGLSVSNKPVKNNVFWGYNTVRDCVQWGAQLQGETGGIAQHYFYRCTFENTVRGDRRARYPKDSGHGFRTNGNCRELVFEDCTFRNNGGYGVQLGGRDVDAVRSSAVRSPATGWPPSTRPSQYTAWSSGSARWSGTGATSCRMPRRSRRPAPSANFPSADRSAREARPVPVRFPSAAGGKIGGAAVGLRPRYPGGSPPTDAHLRAARQVPSDA